MKSTYTITFGDQAESHVGMEQLGQLSDHGFTINDLKEGQKLFESQGSVCQYIRLNDYLPVLLRNDPDIEEAGLLVIRKGVDTILQQIGESSDNILEEHQMLKYDSKAVIHNKVVNKHARHNLCFGEYGQETNYEKNQGTVIAFKDIVLTNYIRESLPNYFGDGAKSLMAEGNYYYDVNKCGIGYHGDTERKKVIGLRLGSTLPLHYQWHYKNNKIGTNVKFNLGHGDIYVMSEKTTGNDFKNKNIHTLKHAAGCAKYTKIY